MTLPTELHADHAFQQFLLDTINRCSTPPETAVTLEELQQVLTALATKEAPTLRAQPGVTAPLLRSLYSSIAGLCRLQPWELCTSGNVFHVAVTGPNLFSFVQFDRIQEAQAGLGPGAAVPPPRLTINAACSLADMARLQQGRLPVEPVLQVELQSCAHTSPADLAMVTELGLAVHQDAYPVFVSGSRRGPIASLYAPDCDELRWLDGALGALLEALLRVLQAPCWVIQPHFTALHLGTSNVPRLPLKPFLVVVPTVAEKGVTEVLVQYPATSANLLRTPSAASATAADYRRHSRQQTHSNPAPPGCAIAAST